jgi:hypothetical protein
MGRRFIELALILAGSVTVSPIGGIDEFSVDGGTKISHHPGHSAMAVPMVSLFPIVLSF